MKQVMIEGKLVEFSTFDSRQTLTEEVNPNFIGYFTTYYENGVEKHLPKPAKFYR